MTETLSLAELADTFTKMSAELSTDDAPPQVLARLADVAVHRVPGAEYSGVTSGRQASDMATVAATADLVRHVDQIQYDLGSGPCVDAVVQEAVYNAGDLRTDPRWPEFGQRAVEARGIVSMLSIRLYLEADDDVIAGLNMYSHQPAAFDAASETVALLLATHGALAVARAEARRKADNLTIALKSSREIGIAMGVLMNAAKVTREQAFDLLRIASQHSQRKLADIATEVADTGVLPAIPNRRMSPRQSR
jgi:GAF domain-containing protein